MPSNSFTARVGHDHYGLIVPAESHLDLVHRTRIQLRAKGRSVAGKLQRADDCNGNQGCGSSILPWLSYGRQHVTLYFDARGSQPRVKVKTLTTTSGGKFAYKVSTYRQGVWTVAFDGNALYTAASKRAHG